MYKTVISIYPQIHADPTDFFCSICVNLRNLRIDILT